MTAEERERILEEFDEGDLLLYAQLSAEDILNAFPERVLACPEVQYLLQQ